MPFFRQYRDVMSVANVRWLALIRFLTNLTFYSTVIVAFQTGRGLNFTEIFWLESVMVGAIFLFEIPSGVLGDRWGHRRMVILGHGLSVVAYAVFALANSFWWFALSSVLFGLGEACLSGSDSALVYESLPEERREEWGTRVFALLNGSSSAGFFFGLVVGSFMGAVDPALPVAVNIVPMAMAWVASFWLRVTTVSGSRSVEGQPHMGQLLVMAATLIRSQPALVGISLLSAAAFALVNAVFWFNQPLFTQAGIPIIWFGPLMAAAMAVKAIAGLSAPMLEQRLGKGVAVALSCLLPGVAYLAAAQAAGPLAAFLFVVLVVGGSAWRAPVLSDAVNRRIPDGARATTLSVLSFTGAVAGMAMNPLIGWVGDQGLRTALIGLGVALVALGCAFPLVLSRLSKVEPRRLSS